MTKGEERLIFVLDVGTSKIVFLVGEIGVDQQLHIIGYGCQSAQGLKRGVVVNIEATVAAISEALSQAELTTGANIQQVYASVSGNHVHGLSSSGMVPIHSHEVTHDDVNRVLDAARALAIPADQKILHVLPAQYIIDHQNSIRDPIGMSGVRLEVQAHIITASSSALQNITKCIQRCHLQVVDLIFSPLAASYAVLTEDEKDLGVAIIDIGAGTTDLAVFNQGAMVMNGVLPIAGDQVTNDLAIALRVPTHTAEEIKHKMGAAMMECANPNEFIEVPAINEKGKRQLPAVAIAEVIEARYEEIFNLVRQELVNRGFIDSLPAGIVLTGGGANIAGCLELAETIFGMPVRLGVPNIPVVGQQSAMHNPSFATASGLLLYAKQMRALPNPHSIGGVMGNSKGVLNKMRRWLQVNF